MQHDEDESDEHDAQGDGPLRKEDWEKSASLHKPPYIMAAHAYEVQHWSERSKNRMFAFLYPLLQALPVPVLFKDDYFRPPLTPHQMSRHNCFVTKSEHETSESIKEDVLTAADEGRKRWCSRFLLYIHGHSLGRLP